MWHFYVWPRQDTGLWRESKTAVLRLVCHLIVYGSDGPDDRLGAVGEDPLIESVPGGQGLSENTNYVVLALT
jgi:hypothetical protein